MMYLDAVVRAFLRGADMKFRCVNTVPISHILSFFIPLFSPPFQPDPAAQAEAHDAVPDGE